ncbi:MAG: hypothetical protein GTN80_07610 [Nitrososphaeria archaeon]|nr:hypothetical protein [Nitrososphaeria archaeon]NIN52932.1 hypothetical protein [Nitrososphaeria archaeon]NIQ33491.1 hypothetical protein [Nitrososphaeria archaeon]
MDLKRIILKIGGDKEFYGYEVSKRLVAEDVKVNTSRLYRVLNEMLKEGLLEGSWERSRFGPRKRVYRLSEKGGEELNKILLDAIKTVHIFYGRYLMNLPPKVNAFDSICGLLVDELKRQGMKPLESTLFSVSMNTVRRSHSIISLKEFRADLKNP